MLEEAFFDRSADAFVPSELTRGPWSPDSLHGRVIAGLFAHVFEREHWEEPFHFARLTVDMFRLPRVEPVQIEAVRVRDGRRIRVVTGTMTSEGREIAQANAVMLRRSANPGGTVWTPESWDAPSPAKVPLHEPPDSTWTPMWETRPIGGPSYGGAHRKRAWLREIRPLVADEALTPFVRVASSADFASPMANSGDQGLHYVNADISLYLHRLPMGEWIGYEVASHQSEGGIAVGDCTLYDEKGPIGKSVVCAVANPHPAGS